MIVVDWHLILEMLSVTDRQMTKPVIFVILCFITLSCASGQKVEVSADKDTDLSRFVSFYVMPGELVLVMNEDVPQDALKEGVRDALGGALADKGYRQSSDSVASDLAVTFVAEVVERIEQQELGPLGQTPARSGADLSTDDTWTQEIRTGSLAIEVIERRTGKTVWRSSTSINFRSFSLTEVLQAAVVRSLRKFPRAKK